MIRSLSRSAGLATSLVLLALLGGGAFSALSASLTQAQCLHTYSLLNPWLHCQEGEHDEEHMDASKLKKDLEAYLATQKANGNLQRAAVAFRYPDGEASFDINGSDLYAPGSLLKVPIMIAVYKQAQEDPSLLSRTVAHGVDLYTVQQLVEKMIVDSDNAAREVLLKLIQQMAPDGRPLVAMSAELRLGEATPGKEDFLRVGTYAALLRTLYDASYLNKAMSQKALALLTQTRYENGVVAGIPDDLPVAHKFGIREDRNQIHDCGIVYVPQHPYIICVMTEAPTTTQGENVIKELSRMTHDFVKAHADAE